jgi:response regulator of citrate/malate metabolism
MIGKELRERFYSKVIPAEGADCHLWSASHFANGYGQFKMRRLPHYAHRIAYELHYGEFEQYLHVLHKCDNPGCVNPKHLFLGGNVENAKDKEAKGRGLRKLTLTDIKELKDLWKSRLFTQVQLGSLYEVSNVAVRKHLVK